MTTPEQMQRLAIMLRDIDPTARLIAAKYAAAMLEQIAAERVDRDAVLEQNGYNRGIDDAANVLHGSLEGIAASRARHSVSENNATALDIIESMFEDCAKLIRALKSAPIADAAPVSVGAQSSESVAWLVACKQDGALVGWLGLWDNEDYGWTLDPNKAIRFARQKDADMMLSKWEAEDEQILSSEEHMWI